MRYAVKCSGHLIGTSQLEGRDLTMGVAFGAFEPGPGYELVRSVFLLFVAAYDPDWRTADQSKLEAYYRARDALGLTLETEDDRPIATSAIHVVDLDELGRELEVHVSDGVFWNAPHMPE
jgi:hypothetical protein